MNAYGLKDEIPAFIIDKAKELNMRKVVLFGSRANGRFSEKSDIDLAISGDFANEFKSVVEDECPTLLEFDFIDMSRDISSELRDRIEEEGIILYEIC